MLQFRADGLAIGPYRTGISTMTLSPQELRAIYEATTVVRRPTYGIISGYHTLPYVCIGAPAEAGRGATRVRGTVHVSPRFVIRPSHYSPSYKEIFGEDAFGEGDEHADRALAGRVFGFLGFRDKPVECSSEHLEVKHLEASVDQVLGESLDELDRREDISTGVIITPDSRYFPVSVERFISSILEDEFSA